MSNISYYTEEGLKKLRAELNQLRDLLIIAAFSGTKLFMPNGSMVAFYVQVACCVLLFYMGISAIIKEPHYKTTKPPKENGAYYYVLQGFLLNILNPGNFFAWVGVTTYLDKARDFQFNEHVVFYTGSLIAIFTTEVLIAYSAKKLKRFLSDRTIHLINLGTGWLFIGSGVYLAYLAIDSIW